MTAIKKYSVRVFKILESLFRNDLGTWTASSVPSPEFKIPFRDCVNWYRFYVISIIHTQTSLRAQLRILNVYVQERDQQKIFSAQLIHNLFFRATNGIIQCPKERINYSDLMSNVISGYFKHFFTSTRSKIIQQLVIATYYLNLNFVCLVL